MVELDNEVMIGCAKHMRSVCGHFLDEGNRKGSNYEVICGDALKYMERVIVSKFISFDNVIVTKPLPFWEVEIHWYICFFYRSQTNILILSLVT